MPRSAKITTTVTASKNILYKYSNWCLSRYKSDYLCNVPLSGMIRSTVSVTTGGARKAPGLSVMRMNVVRSWTSVRGASAPAQVIKCIQFGNVDLMQLMVQMEIRVTKSLRKVANKDGRNGMEGYLYAIYPTNIFLSTNYYKL